MVAPFCRRAAVEFGLLALPGVVGVGLGAREENEEFFDELAVRILVEDANQVPDGCRTRLRAWRSASSNANTNPSRFQIHLDIRSFAAASESRSRPRGSARWELSSRTQLLERSSG
jgi:hypothetical protein